MSNLVIKAEKVSKQYRLGTVGTGSFAHDVNRLWYKMRGREDPYSKVGERNIRTQSGTTGYVWALKDINFSVSKGEVLGIIGRNGAGKSTLLKILSRTTAPTTGSIKVKGRIASLLEVGTGFHPELTGRDNIFLNGAILGMTKPEIKRKFDEIVDFAGVARYIDTPVKRYSSGMYVRLAFGVAAHLEPEILVVDEVLAVGDAEFQKKALGKMKDVSQKDGRTVLFVSHNMAAVQNLCNRGLLLQHGEVATAGPIAEVIRQYQQMNEHAVGDWENLSRKGAGLCKVARLSFENANGEEQQSFQLGDRMLFHLSILNNSKETANRTRIILGVYNQNNEGILRFDTQATGADFELHPGASEIICRLDEHLNIRPDTYYVNIALFIGDTLQDYIEKAVKFDVENCDYYGTGRSIENPELAKVFLQHSWFEKH